MAERLIVGLLVTGKLEEGGREGGQARASLAELFRPLRDSGLCEIKVVYRQNQWQPKKLAQEDVRISLKLTVRRSVEKTYLPEWKQILGVWVRSWLQNQPNHYLVFMDDRENSRSQQIAEIFEDYLSTMTALLDEEARPRASVHFLVNMTEAYYFADPEKASLALGFEVPRIEGDPEDLPNPYSDLKREAERQGSGYGRKRESGEKVLGKLRLEKILEKPQHCSWLRAAVRWIVHSLEAATDQPEALAAFGFRELFHLDAGKIAPLTGAQEVYRPGKTAAGN